MSWFSKAGELLSRHGGKVKFAARLMLQTAVPGSGVVAELVGQAFDAVRAGSEMVGLPAVSAADLLRVEEVLDLLGGRLDDLTRKIGALETSPQEATDLIREILTEAGESSIKEGFKELANVASRFDKLEAQNREILAKVGYNNDLIVAMMPILRRLAQVLDFSEEMMREGVNREQAASSADALASSLELARTGDTSAAQATLIELEEIHPESAAVQESLAVSAALADDPLTADRALARAAALNPEDKQLAELSRRITLATGRPGRRSRTIRQPRVGDVIDGWRLTENLGYGGYGRVFRASKESEARPSSGRPSGAGHSVTAAALKLLHPEHTTTPTLAERFRREIETLRGMPRHPSLVAYQGSGQDPASGSLYLLMELIEGESLQTRLDREGKPLPYSIVLPMFGRIADALAALHAAGIAHRDIKPANIRVRPDGTPVLVDFGLAWMVDGGGVTRAGQVAGHSAWFAAPEQVRFLPVSDYRPSDVYSLAGTMVFALLFTPGQPRVPDDYVRDELLPVLPKQLDKDEFVRELEKALSPRPRDRYPTAKEFRDALAALKQPVAMPFACTVSRDGKEFEEVEEAPEVVWLPPGGSYTLAIHEPVGEDRLQELSQLLRLSQLRLERIQLSPESGDGVLTRLTSISPELRRLNLSGCTQISDEGLSALAGFADLEFLDLTGCSRLTAASLRYLAPCQQLLRLVLDQDWVGSLTEADVVPAGLKRLKKLDVKRSKRLTAAGLAAFKHLPELKEVPMPAGWLQLRTDRDLSRLAWLPLPALEGCFRVTGDCFDDLIEQEQFQEKSLDLSGFEDLTDDGLSALAGLAQLEELNLRLCECLTGEGLRYLSRLPELRSVNISSCWRMTDEGLRYLAALPKLQELRMAYCYSVTDAGIAYLARLTNLTVLDLDGARRATDDGLARLAGLTGLTTLDLKACSRLGGRFFKELAQLPVMHRSEWDLTGYRSLDDDGLSCLTSLPEVTSLSLSGHGLITNSGLGHLSALPALSSLSVANMEQLTNQALLLISGIGSLTKLRIWGCKGMTGKGLMHLRTLGNLKTLEIPWGMRPDDSDRAALVAAIPGLNIQTIWS